MDPTNGYRGLRRRSCSMELLEENSDDFTPAFLNTLNKFLLDCSAGENLRCEASPLADHLLLSLRRRIPQMLRVELEVGVCVPLGHGLSARQPPRALAASPAAVPSSAFPGVSGAHG